MGIAIDLLERESPVTLIAARDFGAFMLFGADSLERREGYTATVNKIGELDSQPIVWGYAGEGGVGKPFDEWMRSYEWSTDSSWRTLQEDARNELSRLNRAKRESVAASSAEASPHDTASVLIAGYLNGKSHILHISSRGESELDKTAKFVAIGSAQYIAAITKHSIESYVERIMGLDRLIYDADNPEIFEFILRTAMEKAGSDCGPPMRLRKITADGVERYPLRWSMREEEL